MGASVRDEAAPLAEALPAVLAHEWPLARVDAPVDLQVHRLAEGLAA